MNERSASSASTALRSVKRTLDPAGILNPGVLLSAENLHDRSGGPR